MTRSQSLKNEFKEFDEALTNKNIMVDFIDSFKYTQCGGYVKME